MVVVTAVHVTVTEDSAEAFAQASLENRQHSVQEPGNLRFDVLHSVDNPSEFLLYEVFASPADAAAHKQTAHYLKWRATVAPMMARPRVGVGYTPLAPADADDWRG